MISTFIRFFFHLYHPSPGLEAQQSLILNPTVRFFFSNLCFWWCYQKYFSEYTLCYLYARCLQSFISKLCV